MNSIAARFVFTVLVMLLIGCETSAQTFKNNPPDVNEQGEEIFGPDYRPSSATVESVPLILGTPNAGLRIPNEFRNRTHQSMPPRPEALSIQGVDAQTEGDNRIIPYLKKPMTYFQPSDPQRGEAESTVAMGILEGASTDMIAHFVFVGQGDGAILEFPCGIAVIDTGGEFGNEGQKNGGKLFINYLRNFFKNRPKYEYTIDVLITTHPHADHLNGLKLLQESSSPKIKVKNIVDNGQTGKNGSLYKQTEFRKWVMKKGGEYSAVEIAKQRTATGATNRVIDPLNCTNIDPIITAFWGGYNEALPKEELISSSPYKNPNNHSVIIRVDYGEASFLFTGDLEDTGERDLREMYKDNLGVFNVDVYQVSHHGAENDTSDEWLSIMTPNIAVISMGTPDLEKKFTAWDHGHPRTELLSKLQHEPGVVIDKRDPPKSFWGFPKKGKYSNCKKVEILQAVYGTGWEGTILISASTEGDYKVSVIPHIRGSMAC